MDLIIPYDDKLYSNGGAFITTDGQIIYTYGEHETFSLNYCKGPNYELFEEVKYGVGFSHYAKHFEDFQRDYHFHGTREEIDEYSSSKLSLEKLALFKLWLEKYEFARYDMFSDFMVYVLGFDKIETIMREAIMTTCANPHIKYFNYYLMDWPVNQACPMIYNRKTGAFEFDRNFLLATTSEDREYEEEISEIRSRVRLKDRTLFFK